MVERQITQETPTPGGRRWARILRAIEAVEAGFGSLLVVVMLVLVMIQVLVRFSPFSGWVWTGELARFGLMWMAFIMAGYLLGRGQHITLDIVKEIVPERAQRALDIVSNLLIAAICAGFAYEGWGQIESQVGITSTAAKIPMTVIYAVPMIGFALTALRALSAPFVTRESA